MTISILQDLKFGLRLIRRSPYVTGLAIFCLASGIGLSTFMFSITWAVVGRGLPFDDQERIIHVMRRDVRFGDQSGNQTPIHLDDYRAVSEQQTSFQFVSAMTTDGMTVGKPGLPQRLSGAYVTPSLFKVLPVEAKLGRVFMEEDGLPDSPRVLILSNKVWRDQFASDPDIIGSECICEGLPYTVVGVMPEWYEYPFSQDVWVPLIPETLFEQTGWIDTVTILGRLNDNTSIEQAASEYELIFQRLDETKAVDEAVRQKPDLRPLFNLFIGKEIRILMWSMFGATFLVLLIACSNVSSILTARMVARTNELAIRSALGADRKRIMVQILGEALVYGMIGAALGLAVAWKALDFLWLFLSKARFSPPVFMEFRMDPISILVAVGLMIVGVLFAGFLPAWRASKTDIGVLLNDSQRTASSNRLSRLSTFNTILQVAFSFALLVAAGRLIFAIIYMGTVDYPFNSKGLLVGSLAVDSRTYSEQEQTVKFWDDLYRNLQSIPGAETVSLGFNMPGVFAMTEPVRIEGETYATKEDYPKVSFDVVAPGYFKTLGVDILDGRDFDDGDLPTNDLVVIVNTVMAERFWPQENPIGKTFYINARGDFMEEGEHLMRVIGVVPDLKMAGLFNTEDDGAGFYRVQSQGLWGDQKIFLRTAGNPYSMIPEVQKVISLIDPNIAFTDAMTFEDHVHDFFFFFRFFLGLFSTFGGMALVLTAAGLYGIIQYSVTQRIIEIGVRMSLGATPRGILWMVFRRGLRNTLIGLFAGVLLSYAFTKALMAAFPNVETEYYSFIASLAVILLVSGLANIFPARRAANLDPMAALRTQ